MKLKEIPNYVFDEYAYKHPLGSFHQSTNYALLMAESGFDYDCIALYDDLGNILAATLILHKKLSMFIRYGYAPKGFLIDYYNKPLLKKFTELLIEHYRNKNFAFIKLNPEIAIGEVDYKNKYQINYNQNRLVIKTLEEFGYRKFKKTFDFDTKLPRFNAILPLNSFDINKISKNTRNKIKNAYRKGLEFVHGSRDDINVLYDFIKKKKTHELIYYKDIYNAFDRSNMIDIFLVKVNYQSYLSNIKIAYEEELIRNSELAELLQRNSNKTLLNLKMQSDKALTAYHDSIIDASHGMQKTKENIYIAGAITIKYKDRINIFISGFDKRFHGYNANYFLHYNIFEHFKNNYTFVDLNGISGDFTKESKFHGLNRFKLSFNPKVFEFIGEFDLVINENKYQKFINSPKLYREFKKK